MICWGGEFDFASLKSELKQFRIQSENPEIWKDPGAKSLFKKIKNIENKIRDFEIIESNIKYFQELHIKLHQWWKELFKEERLLN